MSQDLQSIEDLIDISKGKEVSPNSAQGRFEKKDKEIRSKQQERIVQANAQKMGVPYINLFGFPVSSEALSLIKEQASQDLKVICFFYDGKKIRVGTTNFGDPKIKELSDKLSKTYHADLLIYLISQNSFDYAFKIYQSLPKILKPISGVEIKEEDLKKYKDEITDYKLLNDKINDVNVSDIVTLIIATAIKTNSSDIHIEAEQNGVKVRLRIDGVLQDAAVIDLGKWNRVVSRMKLLAKVKINITDKPQDGRYTIFLNKEEIEVRSSFLPTNFGESVVMRLLKSNSIQLAFEDLGLMPRVNDKLKKEMVKPNGLLLITGPTGSGKTTTLYSILRKLNSPKTKIITLENPVEYHLEGINQSQVDPKKGYTFANGLRSILRQDPDIVMVGEIRDVKTAETAVQASLTGHLVLSTLHTNDASGVIPRLVNMGVKPYFLTPSINAIIGQRLVRKLCDKCKVEYEMSEEEKAKVDKILAVISSKADVDIPVILPKVYKVGEGCSHCNGIGYKGRVGIYELFTMSDEIKQLASDGAHAFKILQQAIEDGMVTMLQDGILKVLSGTTSLEEVYRVIGKIDYIDSLYDIVVSRTFGRGIKINEDELSQGWEMAMHLNDIDRSKIEDIPVKEMINIVLATAIKGDAGDIHIEPTENSVNIRFRIDGILHDFVELSQKHYLVLLARIKILAGFPTNVKKATWDGRFSIYVDGEKMDCRVSIISGGYGETVVIRILANQAASLDMEELGIKPYTLEIMNSSIKKTRGMIITTGPTGSGKTTTLYSLLNKLNRPDVKIITIEDPIEYHLDGIIQTQIDANQGYTFAKAMRSLLRQNPNIIMVGEIRDNETAKIAIEASQTGHLVLSTVHANSAAGVITRFEGLGIDKNILANSIETSIGQRLIRRLCPVCKKESVIDESRMEQVKKAIDSIGRKDIKMPQNYKFYEANGCEKCNGIGYKGRLGLYETITPTQEMKKVIQTEGVTVEDIERQAIKDGGITMFQDGILKALEGLTSLDEVFRVSK